MKTKLSLLALIMQVHTFAQVQLFDPISSEIKHVPQRSYSVEDGKKYNQEAFYQHPDFGRLTFNAPYGKRVVEDISKRTFDSRYYIDLDNPTFFYIEKSSGPINTYIDGYWRAIDPTLHKVNEGLYQSGIQPCPTRLDIANKKTQIQLGNEIFSFNNYALKVVKNDNSIATYQADWSQIAVGNEGAYITDVFPGIDMKILFSQGMIKADFIIRENLGVKKLIFSDYLGIPSNMNGILLTNEDNFGGIVLLENIHTGEAEIKFNPARCHDASGSRHSWLAPYHLNGNVLEIVCDSAQLNDPSKVYPITVDPLVTVVGPIASATNVMGSRLTPAFCSNTINVSFPGGSTPWDVSAFWNIYTDFCADDYLFYGFLIDCWRSEAEIWITSSCGGISPTGAPGTIWLCPGCDNYGTWNPTLPFGSSGTQTLAQCYSPSCNNQNMSFTINSRRIYCSSNYGYDLCPYANSYCNTLIQWSVTVQGRTAETLGNTATGNGTQTIALPSCASGTTTLNPTPLYGVPGYTYNWNTGASSSTITVPNAPGTYTATVTDACGTVRTATFTVTCPLGIELNHFDVELEGEQAILTWETLSEKDNNHFSILRAGSDLQFEVIGTVPSQGNSDEIQKYRFVDLNPLRGINYYQLASTSLSNETQLSEVRSITTKSSTTKTLSIIPNPNNGQFTIEVKIPETGSYFVEVIGTDGRIYFQEENLYQIGMVLIPLTKLNVEKGTYLVRVRSANNEFMEKVVIE